MSGETIERLRAESSRGDYASMVRLALALYDAGRGPHEVLRECYGVDLPAEFFALAEAGPQELHLVIEYTNQPWELAVPPEQGGPSPEPDLLDEYEQKIFARDPDLLPLGLILDTHSSWYHAVLCYRLTELASGRTAVFGIPREVRPQDEVVLCGDSFLAVLHEHHADVLRGLSQQYAHPSNRGFGSVGLDELAEVRSLLERVEELQRQVAANRSL